MTERVDSMADSTSAKRDPSGDLLRALEAAERDLEGIPEEMHVRATLDALASVRTALDIARAAMSTDGEGTNDDAV